MKNNYSLSYSYDQPSIEGDSDAGQYSGLYTEYSAEDGLFCTVARSIADAIEDLRDILDNGEVNVKVREVQRNARTRRVSINL